MKSIFIMKLCLLILRAHPNQHAHMEEKRNRLKRWMSTYSTLRLHAELQEAESELRVVPLDVHMLNAFLQRIFHAKIVPSKSPKDVISKLQRNAGSFYSFEVFFDSFFNAYRTLKSFLHRNACIFHSSYTNSTQVFPWDRTEIELSFAEKRTAHWFLFSQDGSIEDNKTCDSNIKCTLKFFQTVARTCDQRSFRQGFWYVLQT